MCGDLTLFFNFVQEQCISLIIDELIELDLSGNSVVMADAVVLNRSFEYVTRPAVGSLLRFRLVVRCISEVGLSSEREAILLQYWGFESARGLQRIMFRRC